MKDFEMPCPCEKCGVIFELDEGTSHAGTIYCNECGNKLNAIEEKETEITDAKDALENAKTDVIFWQTEVEKLEKELEELSN